MAVLKLKSVSNGQVVSQVDLLSSDVCLEDDRWRSRKVQNRWQDTFTLMVRNATGKSAIQILERLLTAAQAYQEDTTRKPEVWLHWKSDRDTTEKRAWVYSGQLEFDPEARFDDFPVRVYLTLQRGHWEGITKSTASGSNLSTLGGQAVLNSSGIGSLGGRLDFVSVVGSVLSHAIEECWVGIRGLRDGSNFNALQDLSGGIDYYDSSNESDTTANGDNRVTITFATESGLKPRAHVDFFGTRDYYGRYLILARYRSDVSGKIQLRYGNGIASAETGNYTTFEAIAYSAATNWRLLPLAVVDIPRQRGNDLIEDLQSPSVSFFIFASKQSGSGSLYLDTLTLLPLDNFMYMNYANIKLGGNGRAIWAWSGDLEQMAITTTSYGAIEMSYRGVEAVQGDGILPWDGAILVVAGQKDDSDGGNELDDKIDVSVSWYPIWGGWS